jgi:hypothetical protein
MKPPTKAGNPKDSPNLTTANSNGMKARILTSVFAAAFLVCSIPDVKCGNGFVALTAPATQDATTATIPDIAGTTGAVGAAFAIYEDAASATIVAAPQDFGAPTNRSASSRPSVPVHETP